MRAVISACVAFIGQHWQRSGDSSSRQRAIDVEKRDEQQRLQYHVLQEECGSAAEGGRILDITLRPPRWQREEEGDQQPEKGHIKIAMPHLSAGVYKLEVFKN